MPSHLYALALAGMFYLILNELSIAPRLKEQIANTASGQTGIILQNSFIVLGSVLVSANPAWLQVRQPETSQLQEPFIMSFT